MYIYQTDFLEKIKKKCEFLAKKYFNSGNQGIQNILIKKICIKIEIYGRIKIFQKLIFVKKAKFFLQHIIFWSKIENLLKNQEFGKKSKILIKIEKFTQTSKILIQIEKFS